MYIYFIVFVSLLFLSIGEVVSNGYKNKTIYYAASSLLLFLCAFRYGQGTDYFNYELLYESYAGENILANILLYRDLFFSSLFYLGNYWDIPFEFFISLISVLSLLMFFKFNISYNKFPIFGLFIFYSIFHLTYNYSAIREGFAISFFLALMFPLLLLEKVPSRYYLLGIVAATMHGSAFITLAFPLLRRLKNKRYFLLFTLSAIICSMVVYVLPFGPIIDSRMEDYVETVEGANIYALLTRFIVIIPVFIIRRQNDDYKRIMNLYLPFFFIYLVLIKVPILAARVSIYLQILSVIVLTTPLLSMKFIQRFTYFIILCIFCGLMYFKCINSFIDNGHYRRNITSINYPYVSIFDKDKIYQYRNVE